MVRDRRRVRIDTVRAPEDALCGGHVQVPERAKCRGEAWWEEEESESVLSLQVSRVRRAASWSSLSPLLSALIP